LDQSTGCRSRSSGNDQRPILPGPAAGRLVTTSRSHSSPA
jgi:hypothetical protein